MRNSNHRQILRHRIKTVVLGAGGMAASGTALLLAQGLPLRLASTLGFIGSVVWTTSRLRWAASRVRIESRLREEAIDRTLEANAGLPFKGPMS